MAVKNPYAAHHKNQVTEYDESNDLVERGSIVPSSGEETFTETKSSERSLAEKEARRARWNEMSGQFARGYLRGAGYNIPEPDPVKEAIQEERLAKLRQERYSRAQASANEIVFQNDLEDARWWVSGKSVVLFFNCGCTCVLSGSETRRLTLVYMGWRTVQVLIYRP